MHPKLTKKIKRNGGREDQAYRREKKSSKDSNKMTVAQVFR